MEHWNDHCIYTLGYVNLSGTTFYLVQVKSSMMVPSIPPRDENFSPTTERLIVLRWLELLHSSLPSHVSNVFAQDLQTKSLKDLQPRINEQIDDLIYQVHNKNDDTCADLSYARFSNSRKFNNPSRNSYGGYQKNNKENRNLFNRYDNRSTSYSQGSLFNPLNPGHFELNLLYPWLRKYYEIY